MSSKKKKEKYLHTDERGREREREGESERGRKKERESERGCNLNEEKKQENAIRTLIRRGRRDTKRSVNCQSAHAGELVNFFLYVEFVCLFICFAGL